MKTCSRGAFFLLLSLGACDTSKADLPRATKDAEPARGPQSEIDTAPKRPGCTRSGAIDAIEKDATCLVESPDKEEMIRSLRALEITVALDAPSTFPGGALNVRVSIANRGAAATPVLLDAEPAPQQRTDLAMIAGVQSPDGGPSFELRAPFLVQTLDGHEMPVDHVHVHAPPAGAKTRAYRVLLAPRASLTKSIQWFALGIPKPPNPYGDDAGHRFFPKTVPKPLAPGAYTIRVEAPLYGMHGEDRTFATAVTITAPE